MCDACNERVHIQTIRVTRDRWHPSGLKLVATVGIYISPIEVGGRDGSQPQVDTLNGLLVNELLASSVSSASLAS